MVDRKSRASMDHFGVRSQGSVKDAGRMVDIAEERDRKTAGKEAIEHYVKKNPAINPDKTHLNIDMFNDGAGGFAEARTIQDGLSYAHGRLRRVTRPIKAGERDDGALTRDLREGNGERFLDTIAGHLPDSMCEPDGTFFQPLDPDTGKGRVYKRGSKKGQPVMLERLRAKDREQAIRYFEHFLDAQAALLPGGREAIHAYSIQFDEGRPHIQIQADFLMPDVSKKYPDGLKSGFQRAFGAHRSDRLVPKLDKYGEQEMDDDGKPRFVREGGSRKMARYHRELKAHMLDLGYDIEAEVDMTRSGRRLDLDDYKELLDAQAEHEDMVAEDFQKLEKATEAAEAEVATAVSDAWSEADAITARATASAEKNLQEFTQSLPAKRDEVLAAAEKTGHAAGLKKGTDAAAPLIEQARKDREAAAELKRTQEARKGELDTRETGIAALEDTAKADGLAAAKTAWEETEGPAYRAQVRTNVDSTVRTEMAADFAAAKTNGLAAAKTAWEETEGPAYRATVRTEVEAAVRQESADDRAAAVAEGKQEGLAQAEPLVNKKLEEAKKELEEAETAKKEAQQARTDAKADRDKAAEDKTAASQSRQEAQDAATDAQRRLAAIPEFDPRAAVDQMTATVHDELRKIKIEDIDSKTGKKLVNEETGEPVVTSALDVAVKKAAIKDSWDKRPRKKPEQTVGERRDRTQGALKQAQQSVQDTPTRRQGQGQVFGQ